MLVLLLGLSQLADWFLREGSRFDLGALARAHAFEIAAAALMALTLAVRLPGLTGDLGHVPLDIDENRLASNIQHYFVTGELVHTTVEHYPGAAFWLFSGASFLRFMRGLGAGLVTTPAHLSVTEFVAAARLANVFVAVGIVTLTALIGRRIAGWWAGLLAGLLVAIAPLSVDTTTVCRCDPVMLLAVLGAVHLALLAQDRQSNGWFVAAGAAAGIAAGVKYSAVFAIVPVWLATLALASWPDRIKAGARALVAFAAAIAITQSLRLVRLSQLADSADAAGGHHRGRPLGRLIEPGRVLRDDPRSVRHRTGTDVRGRALRDRDPRHTAVVVVDPGELPAAVLRVHDVASVTIPPVGVPAAAIRGDRVERARSRRS